jgi:hypothetical protein
MQANGAEMLRLACCLATERRILICAPVHDAVLVEAAESEIEAVVEATQAVMVEASRVVLEGFELRSDAKIVRHPERYSDPRDVVMWQTVMDILAEAGLGDLLASTLDEALAATGTDAAGTNPTNARQRLAQRPVRCAVQCNSTRPRAKPGNETAAKRKLPSRCVL